MNVLRVGRYRVLSRLGDGASADVYLAEDTVMRRKVALKLSRRRDEESSQHRRFEREAWCASALNHPNIVTVFDVGTEGDFDFIASEYVEGETLRQRMQRGPIPVPEAVDIAIGAAAALAAAHEAWIVHRDIKPENVMLRRDRGVKVLDFGVATIVGGGDEADPLRRPGNLVGTLHYLSPEQVRGDEIIDMRSDIYSLGVVLYEMLAERPPFHADDVMEVLASIVERKPDPLPDTVPLGLHRIVERAIQKDIWGRYPMASDMLDDLAEFRLELAIRQREDASA